MHTDGTTLLGSDDKSGVAAIITAMEYLINNPEIILADEPTGNLDTETSTVINGLFKKINDEKKQSIIIVTHSLELANLAKSRYKVEKGKFSLI